MGSTPSIDLQDAAIRGKLKDIKTLTDPIENGGQNMDINEQDEELGYSALTEAIKCMHIVGSKKKMIKMYEISTFSSFSISSTSSSVAPVLLFPISTLHKYLHMYALICFLSFP